MIITVLSALFSLLGLICFIPDAKKEARYMYWGVGGDLRKLNFIQKLFIRVFVGTTDQINTSSNGMLRPNYLRIFGMFFIFVATILAFVNIFT